MPERSWLGFGNLLVALAITATVYALLPGDSSPASTEVVFVDAPAVTPPSASDLGGPAADAAATRVHLLFAGDIMQHAGQAADDFDATYIKVAPLLRAADLAIGNLEFPVFPAKPVGPGANSVQFNGSTAHLDALARAGFRLLSTSNNHAFDQGLEGMLTTIDEVTKRGIGVVGTAATLSELQRNIAIREVRGIRIGFIAYTGILNTYLGDDERFLDPPRDLPLLFANFAEWDSEYRERGVRMFREHVARARSAGADLVVALPHWGEEWNFGATDDQRRAAHDLVDAGFDLVVGGHGHVINSPEVYRGKLIAYALGNFVCDFAEWQARTGALLDVVIVKDASGPVRVADFSFRPLLIRRDGHVVEPLDAASAGADGEAGLSWQLAERLLGTPR